MVCKEPLIANFVCGLRRGDESFSDGSRFVDEHAHAETCIERTRAVLPHPTGQILTPSRHVLDDLLLRGDVWRFPATEFPAPPREAIPHRVFPDHLVVTLLIHLEDVNSCSTEDGNNLVDAQRLPLLPSPKGDILEKRIEALDSRFRLPVGVHVGIFHNNSPRVCLYVLNASHLNLHGLSLKCAVFEPQ